MIAEFFYYKVPLWLYNYILIPLAQALTPLVSLFLPKIKAIAQQHQSLWMRLDDQLQRVGPGPRVWFHVSSAGEFLQAKPVIEGLKKTHPHTKIFLTYVSPSATKWVQSLALLDLADFYPLDSQKNVQKLIQKFKPSLVVLVKFDLWPNLIHECSEQNIPLVLISATLTKNSNRYKVTLAKNFFKFIYKRMTKILCVSEKDLDLFRQTNPEHTGLSITGDTRTDSVLERQADFSKQALETQWAAIKSKYAPILVCGSTWPQDEGILIPAWKMFLASFKKTLEQQNPLLILVPHEPTESHLQEMTTLLKVHQLSFSRWSQKFQDTDVLIFDQVGGLAQLYRIADAAFVGSGQGGVHNTMEPAAWRLPVFFRDKYFNAPEAIELVDQGVFQVMTNPEQLHKSLLEIFLNKNALLNLGNKARAFLEQSQGAAQKSCRQVLQFLGESNRPLG